MPATSVYLDTATQQAANATDHAHASSMCLLSVAAPANPHTQDQAVSSSMHQLAHYLQQLGSSYFPDLQQAKFAEFWAHCRRHSSGIVGGKDGDGSRYGCGQSYAHTWSVVFWSAARFKRVQPTCMHCCGTISLYANQTDASSACMCRQICTDMCTADNCWVGSVVMTIPCCRPPTAL